MIDTAEPGGSEKVTSETIRSGPAGVEYSLETFSTSSKPYLLRHRLRTRQALVSFQQPIGHVRRAVVLADAAKTIRAEFSGVLFVSGDLQNSFRESRWVVRLDENSAAGVLDDLSKRAAPRLDERHAARHRFEQRNAFRLVVRCRQRHDVEVSQKRDLVG